MMSLQFPALALGVEFVRVYQNESDLGVASKTALRNRYHDSLELIDSVGTVFRISGFEQVREVFWKRPKTPFGRGVRLVNFTFEEKGKADLEEVKERLRRVFTSKREFWEASTDVDELIVKVDAKVGFVDLIETVRTLGH